MTLTDLSENFGGLETSMGILEKFSDFQLVVFSLLIFWTYIYNMAILNFQPIFPRFMGLKTSVGNMKNS